MQNKLFIFLQLCNYSIMYFIIYICNAISNVSYFPNRYLTDKNKLTEPCKLSFHTFDLGQ